MPRRAFTFTRREEGWEVELPLVRRKPLRVSSSTMHRLARTGCWLRFWGGAFASAALLDVVKLAIWLLVLNWKDELPFHDSQPIALYLVLAFTAIVVAPFLLCDTGRYALCAYRDLFLRKASVPPIHADFQLSPSGADRHDEEPPEPRRCGIPVSPRHPSPLGAHAKRELVTI